MAHEDRLGATIPTDGKSAPEAESNESNSSQSDLKGMPASKLARVVLVGLFGSLGAVLAGLDIGYLMPIVFSDSFKHDVAHVDKGMISGVQLGLFGTFFLIGSIIASFPFVSALLLERFGGKNTMMFGAVLFLAGSIVQGTAWAEPQFLMGRVLSGAAIGLLACAIVPYQSELAPPNLRGVLATLYQLGLNFGIVLASVVDQMFVDRSEGWRMVMGVICVPALLLLSGVFWMPHSPRWLVLHGRRKEALEVLRTLRSESDAVHEEGEIHAEVVSTRSEGEVAWSELLHGRTLRLLVVGASLQLLQQMVGMGAVLLQAPQVFELVGINKNSFFTAFSILNFLTTFIAVFFTDRCGRRALLVSSAAGMTVSLFIIGALGLAFVSKVPVTKENEFGLEISSLAAGWAIGMSALFFVFNFAYGFGPIVWVYISEIFPLRHRSRCFTVCVMSNFVGNIIIGQFTPMLLEAWGFWTFMLFGVFCCLGVFMSAWLPETRGVPLESVQKLFDGKAGFRSTNEIQLEERQREPA